MSGLGRTALDTILGMLGIVTSAGSKVAWATLRHAVGVVQQHLADCAQVENRAAEIAAMQRAGIQPVVHNGQLLWPLTVSFDMAWQKRAAGRAYNSPSGHAFFVAGHTKKIVSRTGYAKACCVCCRGWKKQGISIEDATKDDGVGELMQIATDHHCPKNFSGSSKSMEARAAVSMITKMFELTDCCIDVLLTDDDATTRSNNKHSFKEMYDAGLMRSKELDWPRNEKGVYLPDHGKLPLHVWAIRHYLADPTHRCKSFGRALYALQRENGRKLKFTNVDCDRLKQNLHSDYANTETVRGTTGILNITVPLR